MDKNIIYNIFKTKLYFNLLVFVTLLIVGTNLILEMKLIPSLKEIALKNILNEAKKVSNHMSSIVDYKNSDTIEIDRKLKSYINDFKIEKIHYFDRDGKVLYSTVKEKIGTINNHDYFHNFISKGNLFHKIKQVGSKSSELEDISTAIIEIYVPIMEKDKFIGAFELYYEISDVEKDFSQYRSDITKINIIASISIFILFVILLYLISAKSLKAEELTVKDYLTGLYNRRYFYEIVEKLILLSKRDKTPLSLCIIDIDNFKDINDTYGHNIGDNILKLFSKETSYLIRKSDVLVRYGGEEFIILFPNTDVNSAKKVATKICDHFSSMKREEVSFTVSIGVKQYNSNKSITELIKDADEALYKAKAEGKNRVIL